MIGKARWFVAAAVIAASIFPAAAQAQYPWGGYGWQSGYGQGYTRGYNANQPYFALHPPVYYSNVIVRRPVGPSPFAYPSWYQPESSGEMSAAPAPRAEPLLIVNPYVKVSE